MNLLFVDGGNIALLVLLLGLLILYPILMIRRNKKEQQKQKDLVDSLKIGEYVLTYSGVFGKIVEMTEKEMGKFIVIETGEKHKNYMTVSENAIYMLANNNPKIYSADGEVVKPEEKTENKQEDKKTEDKKHEEKE